MGPLPHRWWALLLAAAVAVPAATLAQDPQQEYKPVIDTACWPCHLGAGMKDFPPLKNFYAIIPPPTAGDVLGTPFTYTVQIQNTWGADLVFYRPTMDITNAPSLAFASNLPPIDNSTEEAIPVDQSRPTAPQSDDSIVEVPFGYTRGNFSITPATQGPTGPALALKIWAGNATGEPAVQKHGLRGEPVSVEFPDRAAFDAVGGYGNWTVRAETTLLPADSPLNFTPPPAGTQIGYTLAYTLEATAIEDRVVGIPMSDPLPPGQARSVRFTLLGTGVPAAGETVELRVDAWVHYDHESSANQNDDNTTRSFTPPVRVEPAQPPEGSTDPVDPGVLLVAEVDPATTIVLPSVQNGATMATISEAVGYAAAFLLISSVWTGGMFGKASRRQLNTVFGSAKRRVAFHNFLSYGILLFASVHTVLFIIETAFYWTVGIIWGGIAILAMFGLGITGAFQVQMIRRWSYGVWRWSHYGLAVAAILFSVVHGLLDGVHFADVQTALGWEDPLDPRDVTT